MRMMFSWSIVILFFVSLQLALGLGGYLIYRNTGQARGLMLAARDTTPMAYTRSSRSRGRLLQEDWINSPYYGAETPQANKRAME